MIPIPDPATELAAQPQPSVLRLIGEAARLYPEAPAIRDRYRDWTYRDLMAATERLARQLMTAGIVPGDVVAIHGGKIAATIVAMLGTLQAGAIMLPLDDGLPLARQEIMLREGNARSVLRVDDGAGTSTQSGIVPHWLIDRETASLIDDDGIALSGRHIRLPEIDPDTVAYIFFTSGTTGKPKGILGRHKGLAHFIRWYQTEFAVGPGDSVAQLTALSFDGALKDIFLPLVGGGTLALPTDRPFDDPSRLMHWLDKMQISVIQTVPSVLASWIPFGSHLEEALRSVRLICLAGEPLLSSLVDEWRAAFPACQAEMVNLYGPTEATILKSFYRIPQHPRPGVQSIGRPIPDTQLLILADANRLSDVGELGEIVIRTPFLTVGYLNGAPEEQSRFIPNPFTGYPHDVVYRTGDLGRYEPDGTISIGGRLDDEIKIHGVRIQPSEVTAVLAEHPSVESCLVIGRMPPGEEPTLVAYVVSASGAALDTAELRAYLSTRLPVPMIPRFFVALSSLPLMPNGKVDRKTLPQPFEPPQERGPVAPYTPVEEILAGIWSDVLGCPNPGISDNFFDLGGHSLLVFQILSRIRGVFGVDLGVRSFFEHPTIVGLAESIQSARTGIQPPPIMHIEVEGPSPLSPGQRRLWFLHQLDPTSSAYTMSGGIRLRGSIEVAILRRCLTEIVRRHEALRTVFFVSQDEPVALVKEVAEPELPLTDTRHLPEADRLHEVQQLIAGSAATPFDLTHGPPVRFGLIRLTDVDHVLMVCMHHIIADGWSWTILMNELGRLYEAASHGQASPLPPLPLQYSDFARWKCTWPPEEKLQGQLAAWRELVGDDLPLLSLPTDRSRPSVQTFRGASQTVHLGTELRGALAALGRTHGATLFITLLAAFKLLLLRYSGQERIVIGSDTAGRTREEIEGLIGFFVNTLVLQSDLSGNPRFIDLLAHVRETTLDAYTYQDLPFDRLVDEIQAQREPGRSPLFDVMFRMAPPMPTMCLTDLEISTIDLDIRTAKFDLTLIVRDTPAGVSLAIEYSTDLFSSERIGWLGRHFVELLSQIVQNPEERLSHYTLSSVKGMDSAGLRREMPEPPMPPVTELVRQSAITHGKRVALRHGGKEWNHREIWSASNHVTRSLLEQGITVGDVVGVHGSKCVDSIVAILGVLRAGAIVLPIDAALPPTWKDAMLRQSRARLLVCTDGLEVTLGDGYAVPQSKPVNDPVGETNVPASDGGGVVYPLTSPDAPAYLFFTSGSTGTPKGILGCQKAISHFVLWERDELTVGLKDRVAQLTTLSFDAVLRDIFLPLTTGACLCLPEATVLEDPALLLNWLEEESITVVHTVPSVLATWITAAAAGRTHLQALRVLCLAGEPLHGSLVTAWRKAFPRCPAKLFNLYGPSETTMIKSMFPVPADPLPWVQPVGYPLPDTQIFVLNREGRPCGVSERGEITIRTPFRALGYLHPDGQTGFRPNHYRNDPGDILFWTGDLGRIDPDGCLRIMGRIDDQVKIHGMRVEPAEVAAVLDEHPEIDACRVLAHEDGEGRVTLVAYVECREHPANVDSWRAYCRTRLPSPMVPSLFVTIDRIPLLPNGKVDRKALTAASQRNQTPTANQPRTPGEIEMAAIWSDLLEVERVGVDDDFFDLGGTSLLATLLMTRIRTSFGVALPLRALFEHPTVAGLAQCIESAVQARERLVSSPLVGLQPAGTLLPLFCVHSIGGGILPYRRLASELGEDQPFYALQAFGLEEGEEPLNNLHAIAKAYIRAIQTVQPRGPFCLGGWSFGGLVAYEMARQLQEQGEEIALLALIDTLAPGTATYEVDTSDAPRMQELLTEDLVAMAHLDDATTQTKPPSDVLDQIRREDDQQFRRRLGVFTAHMQAARRYILRPIDAPVTLFSVMDKSDTRRKQLEMGWQAVETVQVIQVPGDHYSVFSPPNVTVLAAALRKQLEGNRARHERLSASTLSERPRPAGMQGSPSR